MSVKYVIGLDELDRSQVASVGGKGAQLGELMRIPDLTVPAGFCVTTDAFRRMTTSIPAFGDRLDQLSASDSADRATIGALSTAIGELIETAAIPDDVAAEITDAVERLGVDVAVAVRSSATAEDLPTASFAGQHDSYLDVVGPAAVLDHVRRCWASLFTERAVNYRQRNGIDHRTVHMAVVVQRMVAADAAGVLFTADPVTSNRTVAAVEAVAGLGEELVSGVANADEFTIRAGEVVTTTLRHSPPTLTDAQALRLVELGRRIEAHFGRPQDVEWCRTGDDFAVVQSRPITTLFPIPGPDDGAPHVYVSVGHGQMMTDPMKPLGWSVWQLTAAPPMHEAAGRLFVEVTAALASPVARAGLLETFGRGDPLIADALRTVVDRGFVPTLPDGGPGGPPPGDPPDPIPTDESIVTELIERTDAAVAATARGIASLSGPELFEFILTDIQTLKQSLFEPRAHQALMAGFEAAWWLNDHLEVWLGETNASDVLTQSVSHNVTSEMGLALLDVADVIRPHPDVIAYLHDARDDLDAAELLGGLGRVAGGAAARAAIEDWLGRYGMRCLGEIDITRPRWSERPATLVPLILANVRNFEPGEARRRFDQGLTEAANREQELLSRLRTLPDGEAKAAETTAMIDRVRTFIGYREYPKYGIVCRYFLYKRALLAEAERLVGAGVLRERDDIFFLTFAELHEVTRTHHADHELLDDRRQAFGSYDALTPPRVITSEGEAIAGSYGRDDVPPGALVGLAVSAGTVEGRARVIADMSQADIEPGDILVTAHTDPSWTPLFVTIAALVTEVGGAMTHGAVIAREYGLPAVVGVEGATARIADGQRIRVYGSDGYVEVLE